MSSSSITVPARWQTYAFEYKLGVYAGVENTSRTSNPVRYGNGNHREAWNAGWREGRRIHDGDTNRS